MSLTDFKTAFSNTYQEIFQKVLVAMKIASTRFLPELKYGQSVTRVKYDISAVRVRSITIGTDRTVDPITDSTQLLTIDRNYGTTFPLSTRETVQAGPLNPASVIGGKVARKTAIFVDGDVLYETVNAFSTFDTGDLTTSASNGTPVTLNSTTVPQLVARAPAKLKRNNQDLDNVAFVMDATASSDFTQYLMGKNIDLAGSVFKNGYSGSIANAEVYVSENLTGEGLLSQATAPTNGDTVTINGVVFTFVSSIGTTAGNVLIGTADETRANLTALINDPATTTVQGVALSAANILVITDNLRLVATNNDTANTMTIVGKGSGRMTLTETFTDATDTWTQNFIHVYFGRMGAIDVVIQDKVDMEMREEPKQRAMNIMSDVLYGIYTFTDGQQQFLDVKIAA